MELRRVCRYSDPGNSATHKENNDLTHCFLQFPMQITIFPLKKLQSIKSFRLDESRSINETQLRNHDNFVLVPSTEERWNNHLQSFLNLNEWIVELFLCSSNAEIQAHAEHVRSGQAIKWLKIHGKINDGRCNNCPINLNPSVEDFPHYKGDIPRRYIGLRIKHFHAGTPSIDVCRCLQVETCTTGKVEEPNATSHRRRDINTAGNGRDRPTSSVSRLRKKKGRTQRNKNRPRHNTGKNTLALVVIETSFHFTVFYFIAFVHLSTTFRPKMENLSLYMRYDWIITHFYIYIYDL